MSPATTSEAFQSQSDGSWTSVSQPQSGPTFVYGTTEPTRTNVGRRPGSPALAPVNNAITAVSGTTYKNKQFNNWVSLAGCSNATFDNCTFPGPATGDASRRIVYADKSGGVAGSVVGHWGAKGQNVFKNCDFSSPLYVAGLLGGHHFIAIECLFSGGVDSLDFFNEAGTAASGTATQPLYIEMYGCWSGDMLGHYPGGPKTDGTHNDGVELTSGSFVYILGCWFDGMMNSTNTTSPYYPVGNSGFSMYQNTDGGQSGNISDVTLDQCWFGGGSAGAISMDEKGHGAMTNLTITNNRFLFNGLKRNLTSPTINGVTNPNYDARALHDQVKWATNVSDPANALTLAHSSNVWDGNITYSTKHALVHPPGSPSNHALQNAT